MNKKILAVAVSGALASLAATASFAQSSVTISGFFNGSYDHFRISGRTAGRASEDRVTDNSSRLLFNVTEDMGGGLSAIGQYDIRIPLDANQRANALCGTPATTVSTTCAVPYFVNGGNQHVGLSSKSWGTIRLGRQDLHYVEHGNFNPASTPTLHVSAGALVTAAHGAAVGRTSRSSNLIWWTSNVMNGVTATLGYSTNSYASSGYQDTENDLAASQRKGKTVYARLGYGKGPLNLVFSHIDEKADWIGTTATATGVTGAAASQTTQGAAPDRKGEIYAARYDFGFAKLGFAHARNQSLAWASGASGVRSKRNNSQIGIGVPVDKASNVALTYTKVGDVSADGATTASTGATHTSLIYSYDLSKRTQLVGAYTQLNNESAAAHSLFYNADNAVGSIGSGANAGEKHRAYSVGIRHSF